MTIDETRAGRVDLHTHSTASDGSLSPAELVETACRLGLKALALTDHDTVKGLPEAMVEAARCGIDFIPGVEISCDHGEGSLHILGYWIDPFDQKLNETLHQLVEYRTRRNHRIIARLRELGVNITYREVEAFAGNEVVGRPHFARILVEKGWADSQGHAFEKFLASGRPAYFNKKRLSAAQGIELIKGAGGMAVLAHPGLYRITEETTLSNLLNELIAAGIQGIEAWYSTHTSWEAQLFLKLAEEYDLAVTGGSDFHGMGKPEVELGAGMERNLELDYSLVVRLRRRYHSFRDNRR